MKRHRNILIWAGFTVVIVALVSYIPIFTLFPVTRDIPVSYTHLDVYKRQPLAMMSCDLWPLTLATKPMPQASCSWRGS